MRVSTNRRERGNTIIEFAFCALFLVPLMLGSFAVGMSIGRSIQVTQVSRDAGHMFARYVDFSLEGNQNLIVRLAAGLNMTRTDGNGVVILTKVTKVNAADCAAEGVSGGDCTNVDKPVIIQRLVVGNRGLKASTVGTPNSNIVNPDGTIDADDYLTDPSAEAVGFESILSLQSGEFAYISEAYFIAPELDLAGFGANAASFARTIF